jgi:hypothetical protein
MIPTWKLILQTQRQINNNEIQSVVRVFENGCVESCLVTAEEYVKWLAEGNTPEPADE